MEQDKKYFVFISYSNLDNEWAVWLRHELEHYHLPASFNGRTDVRDSLREVFRDRDELSAGPEWDQQVHKALENTNNLIVICSPHSAKSEPVNKEVEDFIAMGKGDHIFPFIVEGNSPDEYFPKSLAHAKVGGDVNKDGGRDAAFVKIVSGMLKVNFSDLWNRYELEKAEEERKQREQHDNLLRAHSRLIAEKAAIIAKKDSHLAQKLLVEVLPEKLDTPNRPYTPEAESVLRKVLDRPNYVMKGHEECVDDIAFSPDGRFIASVSHDNTLRLWDIMSGKQIWMRDAQCSDGMVAYSKDGTLIASSSWSNRLNIWNSHSGELMKQIQYEDTFVYGLAFTSDDRQLMLVTDKHVILYDVSTEEEKSQAIKDNISSAVLSFDCRFMAVAKREKGVNKTICVYEIQHNNGLLGSFKPLSLKPVHEISGGGSVNAMSFVGGEDLLAVSFNNDNNKVLEYNISEKGRMVGNPMTHTDNVDCIKSVGTNILTASGNTVYMWEPYGIHCIQKYEGHTDCVKCIQVSPDEKRIASASWDGTIRIWSLKDEQSVQTTTRGEDPFEMMDKVLLPREENQDVYDKIVDLNEYAQTLQTPDGKWFVTWTEDNCVTIWDAISGECVKTLSGHTDTITYIDISFDSKYIATSSDDKTIRVWDISTGECIQVLIGHENTINSVEFNHENNKLVSASEDKTLRIWDIATGKQLNSISVFREKQYVIDHSSRFHSIYVGGETEPDVSQKAVFSLDDNYVVSGYGDNILRIWDAETGYCVQELRGHDDDVYDVYVCSDGRRIVSTSIDKISKIWDIPPLQELIDETRERFKDNPLTLEERRQYYLE